MGQESHIKDSTNVVDVLEPGHRSTAEDQEVGVQEFHILGQVEDVCDFAVESSGLGEQVICEDLGGDCAEETVEGNDRAAQAEDTHDEVVPTHDNLEEVLVLLVHVGGLDNHSKEWLPNHVRDKQQVQGICNQLISEPQGVLHCGSWKLHRERKEACIESCHCC